MKKRILCLTIMTTLLQMSHLGFSQTFSSVSPSGHTLYFWIDEYCDTCTSAWLVYSPNSHGPWYDTIEVSAYHNYTGNLVIPETIAYNSRTYNVNRIEERCFINCAGLTSVILPSTINYISPECFENCTGLTSITIPSAVNTIGWCAFMNCTGLTAINYNADNCYGYESSFYGCENISTINIGDNVRVVSSLTFQACKNITNLTIGKNVETFHWNALADTLNSLNTVNYNAINMNVLDNRYTNSYRGLFEGRINTIANITIGNEVEIIQALTFSGCSNLTSVAFNADSCTSVGYSEPAFSSCHNINSFIFGNNVKSIPAYLCSHMENLTSVTIPNSVKIIGDGAFRNCTGLTSITIPDATSRISWTFLGCTGLQSVTVGSSVEYMSGAFRGCSHLTSIRSRAEYPPICNEDSFNGVPAYADVIVPCGAAYRYQVTDYWRDFSRITEDCDGIEDINMDDVRAWPEDGRIRVEGANGAPVNVFDMEGRNVRNEALPAGVYMVKVGNLPARKVVVVK